MDDLTTRLLAAIDAKEARARAAKGHSLFDGTGIVIGRNESVALGSHVATHIADNSPDVVLRRCAADRKIVAEARGLSDGVLKDDPVAALGDLVLALLAEGYGITEETDRG